MISNHFLIVPVTHMFPVFICPVLLLISAAFFWYDWELSQYESLVTSYFKAYLLEFGHSVVCKSKILICSFRKKVAKELAKTAAVVRAAVDEVKADG